jgi:hypothetical protein
MAKRLKHNIHGSKYSDALHGELSRKEERLIARSWERFWDPSRARDILRDAGVFERLEEQTARNLLFKAIEKFRTNLRGWARRSAKGGLVSSLKAEPNSFPRTVSESLSNSII